MLLHDRDDKKQAIPQTIIEKLLFCYTEKLDINIHWSLASANILLAYRVIALLALSLRTWIVLTWLPSYFISFQFLTLLGFQLTWLYFVTVCLDYLLNQLPHFPRSPKLKEWVNLLFEASWCIQFPITILFWTILFDPQHDYDTVGLLQQIGVHGFPLGCLLIDFLMNVYQFPRRHLLVIICLGVLYSALNCGYSLVQQPIYPPIDWVSLWSYIWIAACVLVVIGVHSVSRVIWLKCRKERIQKLIERDFQSRQQSILSQDIPA